MHSLDEVPAHRTSSNLLDLQPHRDSTVYRLLVHEFGVVRLYRTFSNYMETKVGEGSVQSNHPETDAVRGGSIQSPNRCIVHPALVLSPVDVVREWSVQSHHPERV